MREVEADALDVSDENDVDVRLHGLDSCYKEEQMGKEILAMDVLAL